MDMDGSGNVTITAATQYGVSATVDLTGEAAATSAGFTTGDSNSNSAEGASDSNISLSSGALPLVWLLAHRSGLASISGTIFVMLLWTI